MTDNNDETKFIEELVNDREKFDNYVYFPTIEEAMVELERRRNDKELQQKIVDYFKDVGIPESFQNEPRLTLFRQIATPNIEVSRFLIIADGVGMKPLLFEYLDDKFTSNNEWKLYCGKLGFYEGIGKKGGHKISYATVINFNEFDGKKIREVKTLWGESLTDFHHKLFDINYSHLNEKFFFDASNWLHKCGGTAAQYYKYFLALFITHGILFENLILTNENELAFGKNIFLPVLKKIREDIGLKPIIVPISPTEIEAAEFWLCQNPKTQLWFKENHAKI